MSSNSVHHLAYICDTFLLKGRGLVATIENLPHGFEVKPEWAVTLFSPKGAVITTTIAGVEKFATLLASANRNHVGLLLRGFEERVKMDGWMLCIHPPA